MESQMIIRIDENLKKTMYRLAQNEGKSASQVVREMVAEYVKERDMGSYIDDLWQRIGTKLKGARVKPQDIKQAIKDVRAKQK